MGNDNNKQTGAQSGFQIGEVDAATLKRLSEKEHDLFKSQSDKVSNITHVGGALTGWIGDIATRDQNEKINSLIDTKPIRAWHLLQEIGAVNTDDWIGVLDKKVETKGVFDNPLTNTLGNIGGTVKGTTEILQNTTGIVKSVVDTGASILSPSNFSVIAIAAGVLVLIIVLK